jgi:hypothetical protein
LFSANIPLLWLEVDCVFAATKHSHPSCHFLAMEAENNAKQAFKNRPLKLLRPAKASILIQYHELKKASKQAHSCVTSMLTP